MHAYYLGGFFNNRYAIISDFESKAIHNLDFDAIVVCGIGGLLFGPILAHTFSKELIVVRKPDDINNHSGSIIESRDLRKKFRYIFVDDLIAKGLTFAYVKMVLENFCPDGGCVGAFTYKGGTTIYDVGFLEITNTTVNRTYNNKIKEYKKIIKKSKTYNSFGCLVTSKDYV